MYSKSVIEWMHGNWAERQKSFFNFISYIETLTVFSCNGGNDRSFPCTRAAVC